MTLIRNFKIIKEKIDHDLSLPTLCEYSFYLVKTLVLCLVKINHGITFELFNAIQTYV